MLTAALALLALIIGIIAVQGTLKRDRLTAELNAALSLNATYRDRSRRLEEHLRDLAICTGRRLIMRGGEITGVVRSRIEGDARDILKKV